MGNSRRETARELARYVSKKIYGIQREYVTDNGSSPRGRATLARLRRDLDGTAPAWMLIGDELFTGWPEDLGQPDEDSPELIAAKFALELYAVHQQSKKEPVAQSVESAQSYRMTFGRACRRIEPDREKAKGILRHLRTVEKAPDFPGIVHGIRSLIVLMRKVDGRVVQIDYRDLVKDLYFLQFPDTRSSVFQRWGRDYFSSNVKPEEQTTGD